MLSILLPKKSAVLGSVVRGRLDGHPIPIGMNPHLFERRHNDILMALGGCLDLVRRSGPGRDDDVRFTAERQRNAVLSYRSRSRRQADELALDRGRVAAPTCRRQARAAPKQDQRARKSG